MDENTWKIVQIIVGQTTLIMGLMALMWKHFNDKFDQIDRKFDQIDRKFEEKFDKINLRLDKIEEKITDIDRRVCRIEGALSSKECCMLKDDRIKQKVE